jgi:hypothetical protein
MFGRFSRRERRFLFAATGVAAAIFMYEFAVDPAVEYARTLREEIPMKAALLSRYKRTMQEGDQAERRVAHAMERLARTEERLLRGVTPALAAAELQELLKGLTAQNKVILRTTSVLSLEDVKPFKKVSLRIDFSTASLKSVAGLLYDIEHHQKVLTIAEMRINAEGHQDPKGVQISLVVAGLMWTRAEDTRIPPDDTAQKSLIRPKGVKPDSASKGS